MDIRTNRSRTRQGRGAARGRLHRHRLARAERAGQVDADTLRRVRDAITKLRYVPHGGARSLRSHRSRMVGAIVPSFDYALYARTTSALQQRLGEHGYSLVLAEHHYDLEQELQVTRQLIEHGVDAFMFVGLDHDPRLFALLEDYGRPYVLTWGVDGADRHPSVGFDNRAAGHADRAATCWAWATAASAILSAPLEGNDRGRERGAGMRAALAEAGAKEPHVEYGSDRAGRCRGGDAQDADTQAAPHRRAGHQRRVRRRRDDGVPQCRRAHPGRHLDHRRRQHRPRRDPDAGADQQCARRSSRSARRRRSS